MITNDGKEIISKYLLGQLPEYATHLAIGCGAKPLSTTDPTPNSNYAKQRMEFEMTRVPISSKGFVDDSISYVITHKLLVSNVGTLTTSVAHDISPGEVVIVSGVGSSMDGQYRVNSVTSNTLSYSIIATNVSPAVALSPTGAIIVSRTKISLTAELPSDNRYDITEVGIWSAANNNLAAQYDSKVMFNFSNGWEIHDTAISQPTLNTNLGFDGSTTTVDIQDEVTQGFYANTSDPIFQVSSRKSRKEGPRYLNRTLMLRGDFSEIDSSDGIDGTWTATGQHIHLNNASFDISGNNTSDLLKLAFSLVDRNASGDAVPSNVKIFMEFFKNEVADTSAFAKAQIYVPGSVLDSNRYHVASMEISQNIDYRNESASTSLPYIRFYTSSDFSSTSIKVCRIFVQVTKSDLSSSTDHFIALDGFRIDNTTENPAYKMSGYSVVATSGAVPITKSANSNNYIDFRFALGVS
jgi:hypothetical protein